MSHRERSRLPEDCLNLCAQQAKADHKKYMVEAFGDDVSDAQLQIVPYYVLRGRFFQRIVDSVGGGRVCQAKNGYEEREEFVGFTHFQSVLVPSFSSLNLAF